MNYIFTCGGTGGHINPAIAVADAIKKKDASANILFIGNEGGMEAELVPKAGYRIEFVRVSGIKRSISLQNARAVLLTLAATRKCKRIIRDFKPDAVMGTGGYVCYPMLRAASDRGVFTAVHESNAIPGLAVRMLKKRMDRIYVNFSECAEALGKSDKILRTGNPQRIGINPEMREKYRNELGISGRYRYVILSFGGSLGARTINTEMLKLMRELSSKHPEVLHVHATGKGSYSAFFEEMKRLGIDKCKNLKVGEYIFDMPKWMNSADAVVCRAGAMTLSELATAGRASVLIPSPNVVDGHQLKNAKAFEKGGAAFLAEENEVSLSAVPELVKTLLFDKKVRLQMEENARKFSFGDASGVIAEDMLSIIRSRKKHDFL